MNFGPLTPVAEAKKIADHCFDQGVFFWDTADMYGHGQSESVVGELLQGRRQEIVLATKVFADMGPGPNDCGLSARHLIAACEASLERLQTDWIDLYYLHLPDRSVPIEETLRAMEDLVRSGKVRYVGCSNFLAWEVMELLLVAERYHWQAATAVQPLYNLVNRDIEVELLPMCQAQGLGAVVYSPLARGVLTGKYSWGEAAPPGSRLSANNKRFLEAEWREDSVRVADALKPLAAERGVTVGQLALAWTLANRLVHSVIIGPKTLAQATESLAASSITWDDELEAAIDLLVPPGCHSGHAFPDDNYYPIKGRSIV
ncbi:MAG: aldo/keto reductase [Proteobacteria bacterium]|jgi:aryl-alcohol dehydrogenase-like predicted oxidoreductase|nr:aldo/keto reductase [Pseudomonadota bacterium]